MHNVKRAESRERALFLAGFLQSERELRAPPSAQMRNGVGVEVDQRAFIRRGRVSPVRLGRDSSQRQHSEAYFHAIVEIRAREV